MDADEHDSWTSDDGREELSQQVWAHEGQPDFQQGAERCRAENSAVSLWAGQLGTIGCCGTHSVCIHLGEAIGGNGNDGETCSDDRNQPCSDIVRSLIDVELRGGWLVIES